MLENYGLILDDARTIEESLQITGRTIPFDGITDFKLAKSFDEFVSIVEEFGCPKFVSFDYDLYEIKKETSSGFLIASEGANGYDCAVWFADWCLKRLVEPETLVVHSANKDGSEKIKSIILLRVKPCPLGQGYKRLI